MRPWPGRLSPVDLLVGGAMGIRVPDLLHAIRLRPGSGRGWMRRGIVPSAGSWPAPGRLRPGGMVTGMATRKVTVTLDEAQLDQIRALVQARTAPSVSGFVQHAVAVALDDIAGWGAMLADALRQTGGPLPADQRPRADDVLGSSTRPAA